jgi:hypothetical protein
MRSAFAIWMTACAAGPPKHEPTCEEVDNEVHEPLSDVVAAHQSCTVAEDCEVVWLR